MNRVTFFTKSDCSLCRSALYVVERVRKRMAFELECLDISAQGQERWLEAYRHDIPVVHLNGREIFRHRVSEQTLERHLKEATQAERNCGT